jgi:hypothetical protein
VRTEFWWEHLKGKDHLGELVVDGRIILKWAFKKWDGEWAGLIWLRKGIVLMNAVMILRFPKKCGGIL